MISSLAAVASAATVRLAVVASSDLGSPGDTPLAYADSDAVRVRDVLNDLGGFRDEDVWLVPAASTDSLSGALRRAVLRATEIEAGGDAAELWVYYTGHAGADGLHLGGEVVSMPELKAMARVVPAAQRVFVVDACQSGTMLRSKGAALVTVTDAPADFVPPTDEAWIASAGAEENAFEVDQRRGALFTHFFVSGARGAADADADGAVTLGELYGFVASRTATEAADLGYVQRPRWAGELGHLVVSELHRGDSGVVAEGPLPRPLLLVDERRGQVVAEIPAGGGARIAVPPGSYQVVALGGDHLAVTTVAVPDGGWATTRSDALRTTRGVRTRGGLVDTRSDGLVIGALAATGRSPGSVVGPGAFVEWRRAVGRGVDVGLQVHGARTPFRTDALRGVDTLVGGALGGRLDVWPGAPRVGPTADVGLAWLHQRVQRAPDPVWGAWFGDAVAGRAGGTPWVAAHGGLAVDVPIGPFAAVSSLVAGPAVLAAPQPQAALDVVFRVGFEFGRSQ